MKFCTWILAVYIFSFFPGLVSGHYRILSISGGFSPGFIPGNHDDATRGDTRTFGLGSATPKAQFELKGFVGTSFSTFHNIPEGTDVKAKAGSRSAVTY